MQRINPTPLTKLTHIAALIAITWLATSSEAFSQQLGQSDWQTPGGTGSGAQSQLGQSEWQQPSNNRGDGQAILGQSEWQQPSNNGGGSSGQAQLGQSGWQQPNGAQQAPQQPFQQQAPQQFQQQFQQQAPQQLGQSGWQQPNNNGGGQTQLGQSGWQQPPLQGSAQKSGGTLGDALQQGQVSSDVDPAAAAMMMNQLKGGGAATSTGTGAAGAFNPAALLGAGAGGADPLAAMSQQLATALGVFMMVMPNTASNNMMAPSSAPFGGGFAVPARAGTVYRTNNHNSGGVGSTINRVLPASMMQSVVRQMMFQGMSRAMSR